MKCLPLEGKVSAKLTDEVSCRAGLALAELQSKALSKSQSPHHAQGVERLRRVLYAIYPTKQVLWGPQVIK